MEMERDFFITFESSIKFFVVLQQMGNLGKKKSDLISEN